MLLSFVLPCADALPGRSTAAAVMADPLTARLRKSLLVLIFVTRANADQFQSTSMAGYGITRTCAFQRRDSFICFAPSLSHAKTVPYSPLQIPYFVVWDRSIS